MAKCKSCGNYIKDSAEICNKCFQSNGDGRIDGLVNNTSNTIVSCQWLFDHLNSKDIVILDASPKSNKSNIQSNNGAVYIPNARYFDLAKDFSDVDAEFPNNFPSEAEFNKNCQSLGINNDSIIVVYDNLGIYSSPRVWWMFQTMGHDNVFVLDGGLPEWLKNEFPVSNSMNDTYSKGNFNGYKRNTSIKDFHFMKTYALICTVQVIDARSKGRFDGNAPEPREGINSGSIPYSINIPFQEVLNNGTLKSKGELEEIFSIVLENKRPKVFTCGSGLTACIILLAAQHIGIQELNVYDGSWTEWATKTQS